MMCPFSHGIAFVLGLRVGLCLLLLSVMGNGDRIVAYVEGDTEMLLTRQGSIPSPTLPSDRKKEPGYVEQTARLQPDSIILQQIRRIKQTGKLKQATLAFFTPQKHIHRGNKHKVHPVLFRVCLNYHDVLADLEHTAELKRASLERQTLEPISSGNVPLLGGVRNLEKLQKLCRACTNVNQITSLRTRASEQYETHLTQVLHERKISQIHRQMGNLRAQCLMLKRHLKSDNSHLRTKRSSKRNRHLKVNKSKKLTGKAGKKPKNKNGSLKVDEAEKVTVKQIRMPTTRQMTDTGNSTTAVLATNRSQKTGDDDVIPHRTYESSALFKGNITSAASVAEGGMNVKEQSIGARSSPGQTTLSESGQSDERMAGSDHGADVENSTVLLGLDGQPVNMTKLLEFLKKMDFERQLSQASQWAYLCVVVLICLMMWTIWCLGGFDHCRYRPDDFFRFTDMQPLTSVKEVLRNKHQYLPMFNEPEWEEVLMCDRGSGP